MIWRLLRGIFWTASRKQFAAWNGWLYVIVPKQTSHLFSQQSLLELPDAWHNAPVALHWFAFYFMYSFVSICLDVWRHSSSCDGLPQFERKEYESRTTQQSQQDTTINLQKPSETNRLNQKVSEVAWFIVFNFHAKNTPKNLSQLITQILLMQTATKPHLHRATIVWKNAKDGSNRLWLCPYLLISSTVDLESHKTSRAPFHISKRQCRGFPSRCCAFEPLRLWRPPFRLIQSMSRRKRKGFNTIFGTAASVQVPQRIGFWSANWI